jgi:hypothetical protein
MDIMQITLCKYSRLGAYNQTRCGLCCLGLLLPQAVTRTRRNFECCCFRVWFDSGNYTSDPLSYVSPFAVHPCDSVLVRSLKELSSAAIRATFTHQIIKLTHAAWNKISKEQMAKGQAMVCLIYPCLWGSNCLRSPGKQSEANSAAAISGARMTLFT